MGIDVCKVDEIRTELEVAIAEMKAAAERLGVSYTFLSQFNHEGVEYSAVSVFVCDGATDTMREIGAACVRDGGSIDGRLQLKSTKEFGANG